VITISGPTEPAAVVSAGDPAAAAASGVRGQDEAQPAGDGRAAVQAAGMACWRFVRDGGGPGGVEVLLVRSARHGTWSWPKGKVEAGETLPECAVREVEEETGVRAVLGRPLPAVRYLLPDGRPKDVHYWAGRPVSAGDRTATEEIDETGWLPLEQARSRLSHDSDRRVLDALAGFVRESSLDTTALLVLRHGQARPRDSWSRADAERPLVAKGRRQALAMAALLRCWQPSWLLSSPWRRCTETLGPFAAASGARLRTKRGLSEVGFRQHPAKARRHVARLLERDVSAVICTHRPVLRGVLDALRDAAGAGIADRLPDHDPWLATGEVLVVHVAHRMRRDGSPVLVAVERWSPA
jgi:8-oxo-dGTP diphosphatase